MSIWETIKSWFVCRSNKVTLDDVLNRPMEISENNLSEILNKARDGDTENLLLAGVLYLKGARITPDVSKALEYLDKSAQASNINAQKILAKEYMLGVAVPQDLKLSFEWTQKAAYSGDLESIHNLGVMYEEGQFVEKDIHKAIECFQKAADQGYVEAKVEIADIYYEGVDLPMDRTRACIMYKEILAGDTATVDVGRINMCLGQAYADKQFFPCGLAEGEGFVYLRNAVEKGYFEAIRILALLMDEVVDEGFRTWLFEYASQHQDNPYCAFALGICYERGYRIVPDINTSFNYYKKSADLGDPWGMHYTACLYLEGKGVEKSVDEWLRLETQAAHEGVPPAQYNLGVCYLKGEHVEKNHEQAKKLFKAAADSHFSDAIKVLEKIQTVDTPKVETVPQIQTVESSKEEPVLQIQAKPDVFRIEHQEDFHV